MKISYLLLLVAPLAPLASAASAKYFVRMTVQGVDLLKGTTKGFETSSPARGLNLSVVAPVDIATGQATGKRRYAPISILQDIDDSSPRVFGVLVTNRRVDTIRVDVQQGGKTVRTYTFTDALITGVEHVSGLDDLDEKITFTFRKWQLETTKGGLLVEDNWGF
ncbi:hypothetical protein H072_7104 [Dactylellina haptotyla CBS 200.50]|uniref:Type VI secretion system tube protein Hcp n=1 Tax=Dactylellina haptotyla (strain CBS 200.50) TaxID=1284197 RepID=S8BUW5_DACHA|nr:hypothetical protein H072_7104 [Dactylellina haptotyla CBS 200.50]